MTNQGDLEVEETSDPPNFWRFLALKARVEGVDEWPLEQATHF